jgi:hypothetical protein
MICVNCDSSCETVCESCLACLCAGQTPECEIICTDEMKKERRYVGHYSTFSGVVCIACKPFIGLL